MLSFKGVFADSLRVVALYTSFIYLCILRQFCDKRCLDQCNSVASQGAYKHKQISRTTLKTRPRRQK